MFNAPRNYIVGQWPESVVLADLNGDGRPDIAVANFLSPRWLNMRIAIAVCCLYLVVVAAAPLIGQAQQPASEGVPVFEIDREHSWVKFDVKASVNIAGKFDGWDANLTFASSDETTGVLEVKIHAASVDTGSGMKNGKLKGKDFFDVEQNPVITFRSTKFVKTGPESFEVDGDLIVRGVSNPEKLTLTVSGKGTGAAEIKGKMVFNRKDYGMNKGIPFIKIADHVDVSFHLREKRVSGPPLASAYQERPNPIGWEG